MSALLCVAPAEGQAVEEGVPGKRVFVDAPPAHAPAFPEECDPFSVPDEFGEGCREGTGNDGASTLGGDAPGAAFPGAAPVSPGSVFRTPPRLECPAAVFVEEAETALIDCRASDEAGEEHLDYYWELLGGTPQNYLDAPLLRGERTPTPLLVAPASPYYETLESFLSEEATLRYRYRYRLTATSRVTGLSSRAEVEAYVLLRSPGVYCPLEYEAPAGSEVVLSCEGADPLSFRMEGEAGSSVSWSWEGLWGSSASHLVSADTPSPVFRAPLDGAGETHHYVASMTTTSSGVPRTARRRVSVRVVEGEEAIVESLSADSLAPKIACKDYEVYPSVQHFRLDCRETNAPAGATYSWTSLTGGLFLLAEREQLRARFEGYKYDHHSVIPNGKIDHEYKVSMWSGAAEVASDTVTVTILDHPELMDCAPKEYEVFTGESPLQFGSCKANAKGIGGTLVWAVAPQVPNERRVRVSRHLADVTGIIGSIGPPYFRVPTSLLDGLTTEYFQYEVCLLQGFYDPDIGIYEIIDSEIITVKVKKNPHIVVRCAGDPYWVYEGDENFALSCTATGAPADSSYAYAWTARGSPSDASLLSATDVSSPMFAVPKNVDQNETYEYKLTVSAANIKNGEADVTVKVFDRSAPPVSPPPTPPSSPASPPSSPPPTPVALSVACEDTAPVYEGSADVALSCEATGAPEGSAYGYVWEPRGATTNTDLLSATDMASPTFMTPAEVDRDETYEYRVTVTAENAEDASADVTVTVLNKGALALTCPGNPYTVYEGDGDVALECTASGAPDGSVYAYAWAPRGATADADLLSATDVASPTFYVPDSVERDETYEYRVTASAENAEDATADVTVTALDRPAPTVPSPVPPPAAALALTCPGNPYAVYEGEGDAALECSASGAPEGSTYSYAWEPRGATANTDLLSATDISSPTFATPAEVDRDETYEYRVTVTAENAEAASADVTVTTLDRPASPPAPPAALFSADPSPLGIASSVSALRFGAQSAGGASLDPLTGHASPGVSGPRHAGRMTLALEANLAFDENAEIALSVELVSPVLLRRASGASPSSSEPLELVPRWSMASSCDAPVSEAIRGLRVQATLSSSDCLLLLFGGDVDLTNAAPGSYSGTIDIVLRAGAAEETRSLEAHVEVVAAQRAIAIGPGGARFEEHGEVPSVLAEEQRLVVYPEAAFMTRESPSGAFELTNPSLVPLEVTAAARFGYAEATEDGVERLVEDKALSSLGDLSEVVNIYPSMLTLMPGERRVVRYGIAEETLASMGERGYAAFFEVVSQPRRPGRFDRLPEDLPEEALQGGTARATLRMPGVYVPGGSAPRLSATLLSVSEGASPSATFLLETDGVPFFGEVSARDAEGRELGRSETLVYARSRVRIALERLPEGEEAFLRFAPRGGGALPAPAPVSWSAPRRSPRDIGAAENNGRPTPNVALAGRP